MDRAVPEPCAVAEAVTGGSADFSFGGSTACARRDDRRARRSSSPTSAWSIRAARRSSRATDRVSIGWKISPASRSRSTARGSGEFPCSWRLEKHKVDRNAVEVRLSRIRPTQRRRFSRQQGRCVVDVESGRRYRASELQGPYDLSRRALTSIFRSISIRMSRRTSSPRNNASLVKAVNAAYAQRAKWASGASPPEPRRSRRSRATTAMKYATR